LKKTKAYSYDLVIAGDFLEGKRSRDNCGLSLLFFSVGGNGKRTWCGAHTIRGFSRYKKCYRKTWRIGIHS